MTLIQSVMYLEDFVLVSSDTFIKRVNVSIDPSTGETIATDNGEAFETDDKVKRLTDHVFYTSLGWGSISERIFEKISSLVEQEYYLEDCFPIFQEVCSEWLEDFKSRGLFEGYLNLNALVIQMIGFKKDGQAGMMGFNAETEEFAASPKIHPDYPVVFSFLPPTNDLEDAMEQFYNADSIQQMGNPISTFTTHLFKVHSIISAVQSDLVSPVCWLHVLAKNQNGKTNYEKTRVDLAPFVATLPPKEQLLEQLKPNK